MWIAALLERIRNHNGVRSGRFQQARHSPNAKQRLACPEEHHLATEKCLGENSSIGKHLSPKDFSAATGDDVPITF
jgi:hypothetical protein